MFFTRFGLAWAWAALVLGVSRIGMGLLMATSPDRKEAIAMYLGNATIGDAINQGTMVLVFGVVLGVLTEISSSLRRG